MKPACIFILLLTGSTLAPLYKGHAKDLDSPRDSAQQARAVLQKKKIPFDPDVFVKNAAEGDDELVKLFLDAGMDPNTTNKLGYTALIWASGQGRENVVDT